MQHNWRRPQPSDHFDNGSFHNLSPTSMLTPGYSYTRVFREMLNKPKSAVPPVPLPSVRTDLKRLDSDTPVVVWFGHSSYLVHCRGVNILVDPVFSGHASPVPFMVRAFAGANVYQTVDMPPIDVMLVTHNHYDHLDLQTLTKLAATTNAFVTSLGVGPLLGTLAAPTASITELDWWESTTIAPGVTLTATPARHFSGRSLVRNKTLWSGFVLQIFEFTLYLGGDSGYDTHFASIGDRFGPFDLALLECGQYNLAWSHIHMLPPEVVVAAKDLKAKVLMPVHWAKFSLANHPWNEPVEIAVAEAQKAGVTITTPLIGEPVVVGKSYPNSAWWHL